MSQAVCYGNSRADLRVGIDIDIEEQSVPDLGSHRKVVNGRLQPAVSPGEHPGQSPLNDDPAVHMFSPDRWCAQPNKRCIVSNDCCSKACYFGVSGDTCGYVHEGRHCTQTDGCWGPGNKFLCKFDASERFGVCKPLIPWELGCGCSLYDYDCDSSSDCCSGYCDNEPDHWGHCRFTPREWGD